MSNLPTRCDGCGCKMNIDNSGGVRNGVGAKVWSNVALDFATWFWCDECWEKIRAIGRRKRIASKRH